MAVAGVLAVDWSRSGLRAWPLANGQPAGEPIVGTTGLGDVAGRDYETALLAQCGSWLDAHPDAGVLLGGMVGARGGWREAPYAQCPIGSSDLAEAATRFEIAGHPAAVLPGASHRSPAGLADVMRGEEVQVLGAASMLGLDRARFCIPGTHAKWADYAGGMLTGFSTYVTGEAFNLFRHQGLVGALADGDAFDRDAFILALERGSRLALVNVVFSARAEALAGTLAPEAVSSYLSGLLIGAELGAALQSGDDAPVVLLASGAMAERYTLALERFGISPMALSPAEAKRRGLALVGPHVWPGQAMQPA